MSELKVGICDDNQSLCRLLEQAVRTFGERESLETVCSVYHRGEALIAHMKAGQRFDLLFLDCNLVSTTGAEVGREIRRELDDLSTQIVFMTAMEGSFEHLMEYQPLRFLRKPLNPEQVTDTLHLFLRVLGKQTVPVFSYKVRGQLVRRPLSDILYFEGVDRCVWVVGKEGRESFYGRLRDVAAELETKGFWLVHRGFLVNSRHVRRFYYDRLLLVDDSVIPISQNKRKTLREIKITLEQASK